MGWRVRAAVIGLLLGVLAVFLVPAGPASAHAALLTSDPPAGTVLNAAPSEVVITFSEPVRAVSDRIRVIAPDGERADAGNATVRGAELRIPLRADGARGTYVVSYRVISADSHPVAGGLTFSVGAPSENAAAGTGDPAPTTGPLMRAAVAAARYAGYAGLVALAGPVLFLLLLWPRRLTTTGPARLALIGAGVVLVATLVELALQIPYSSGGSFSMGAAQQVFGSPYGTGHLTRLATLAALFVIIRPVVHGRAGTTDRLLLGLLAVIGAVTWPISGHPRASRLPLVSVVSDAVHLAAMAVWLGGLVVVAVFLLRHASVRELRAILPVWSRWALLAVVAIIVTGTISALIEINSFPSLLETLYGRLVLAKIGFLAVIVAVAASVRRRVHRSYVSAASETDEPMPGAEAEVVVDETVARTRLRRGVLVELCVAAVVLALASVLVQSTPSRSVTAATNEGPYSVTLSSKLYQLQFDIDPLATGANTVHLYAYSPAGAPLRVLEWRASASLPDQGLEPVDIPLVAITDNHASGQATLPTAGTWELRFTLRTTDVDQATVTHRVRVP